MSPLPQVGWSALLVALCAELLAPARASACTCKETSFQQGFAEADAVFEGRVTAVGADSRELRGAGTNEVQMDVVRSWKGVDRERVTVRTAESGARCGYPFETETSYLVYARRHEGALRTSLCSRTQPVADAEEDLAELGSGVTPVEPSERASAEQAAGATNEDAESAGCQSCHTSGSSRPPYTPALLGMAGGLWVTLRRRRQRARRPR